MKRKYIKPKILIEDFKISQSIAVACSINLKHSENDCTLEVGGGSDILIFNNSNCNFTAEDFIPLDKTCYLIPVNLNSMFGS